MEQSDQSNWKMDPATVKDLAEFLRVDRIAVPGVMTSMQIPKRGAGYPWVRIWVALGIAPSSIEDPKTLKAPLLELKEVAAMLGESPKTTRRRSEGEHRDKSIPAHIDLGPRKRLFFPAEIQSWILAEPVPFERKQENLTFIPAKVERGSTPKNPRKEPEATQPAPSSAAALFMAPPIPC